MKKLKSQSCPFCGKVGNFRELSFGELTGTIGKWGVGLLKNPLKMFGDASHLVSEGKWENYRCCNCNGQVHQCGGCGSVEPYQDTGAVCKNCSYR